MKKKGVIAIVIAVIAIVLVVGGIVIFLASGFYTRISYKK